jgi:hypothetical protein
MGGLLRDWRKSIILLEGSQASPACPFDKSRVKEKKLERLVTWDGGREIFIFWINVELYYL